MIQRCDEYSTLFFASSSCRQQHRPAVQIYGFEAPKCGGDKTYFRTCRGQQIAPINLPCVEPSARQPLIRSLAAKNQGSNDS